MAVPLIKRSSPVGVNLNATDRKNVAKILEAHNLPDTISNSEFLRKVFEIAANPTPSGTETDCTEYTTKITELEKQLQAAQQSTAKHELENKISTLEAENTKLSAQLLESPKTVKVPIFSHEGKVAIPVTDKMEKALAIRQKRGLSESMAQMCSQAVKYCIKTPLHDLFTGRW